MFSRQDTHHTNPHRQRKEACRTLTSILVVDDDPLVGLALKVRLESLGYVVSLARNCAEAESSLNDCWPELLLTDINMPGCDGIELARRVRAHDRGRQLPVVFITASMDPQLRTRVREAGAVGFLGKPYTAQELADMVSGALATRTGSTSG